MSKGRDKNAAGDAGNDGKRSDYEVGYGKPPKSGQFPPGTTGNPSGRPKKPKNTLEAVARKVLEEEVDVVVDGRRVRITKLALAIKQQLNEAAKGDRHALMYIAKLKASVDAAAATQGALPDLKAERAAVTKALSELCGNPPKVNDGEPQ